MERLQCVLGLVAFVGLGWALGEARGRVSWRVVAAGLALQVVLAAALLRLDALRGLFAALNRAVLALQAATEAGAGFVFGYLGGAPLPFEETWPGASFVLAFRALPLVIVVSALTSLLTYWRILPAVVRGLGVVFERTLGVGGAVSLALAANVFVGMVESPLFIRAWLRALTRAELFLVMSAGMATIAGTVLVLYAAILETVIPSPVGHLLTASLISVPAVVVVAHLMVPGGTREERAGLEAGAPDAAADPTPQASSTMDAITRGTRSGLELYLNIVAMLLVLVALVHLVNALLGWLPAPGGEPITLERLLGLAMAPLCWLMGIPWSEAPAAGALMGVKTVLNEFIAYLRMAALDPSVLGERSRLILAYALCGFANPGSLGILVGGLATLVPERRDEVLALGPRCVVAGTLATMMTGATVGLLA